MTKRLLSLAFKSYPSQVVWILILTLSTAVFAGVGMGLILPIMEGLQSPSNITPTHPLSRFFTTILTYLQLPVNLWVLFVSGLALFAFQAILQYLRGNLAAKTSSKVEAQIRVELFSSLLRAQLGYFHQKKVGDLANGIVTEAQRAGAAFLQLISTMASAGLAIAYLLIAFLVSWELSLVAFSLVAPLIYFTRHRERIRQRGEEITQANNALQSVTVESLLGIREVKTFGLEQYSRMSFSTSAENVSRENWLLTRLNARFKLSYEVITVGVLLILISLSFFVLRIPIAEVVAFVAILFRLSPTITNVQSTRDKFLGCLPGYEVVNKILEESNQNQMPTVDGAYRHNTLQSSILFQNVSFAYEGYDVPVLRNINLPLEQGKTTAIVGASGAGKSTLVDLIMRLYDPTEGQIFVDGVDLKQIDLTAWRSMIGFVSQDTFLFNNTVLKNIWYGNLETRDEEVVEAAKRAYAHEFIVELPQGYNTIIGDRGVKLSGGQRQRLALARAILRNPQILILDEATSDLDSKSEHLIQDALREISLNRTMIVIAHRLSTIEEADEIIVLEGGRIVERGTHDELLEKGQYYSEYYNLQYGKHIVT